MEKAVDIHQKFDNRPTFAQLFPYPPSISCDGLSLCMYGPSDINYGFNYRISIRIGERRERIFGSEINSC